LPPSEKAGVAAPGWASLDVLVAVNDGPPVLLKNAAASGNHWLGVRLIGKKANPDAVGVRIRWQTGDLKSSRLKVGGSSYLSAHDPREVVGVGPRTRIERLDIQWPQPSGKAGTFTDLPSDRYITMVEGSGIKRLRPRGRAARTHPHDSMG
jgi:enediyne biosynthesis protein E4